MATRLRWAAFPLALFAFTRLGIALVVGWSLRIDPRLHRPGNPFALPFLEGLCWWDCGWYERIAREGYQSPVWANFFPLFPLIGRALHLLTGMPITWCLVLGANLAGLGALLVIYRLFAESEGEEVARLALALWAAWPFTFFQAAGYPESLMVLSSALSIYWAVHRRHLWSGAALGVGILARHLTIVALPSLIVAHVEERGPRPSRLVLDRAFAGLLLALVVAGTYPAYLWVRFGDPLAWLRARSEGWGEGAWLGIHQLLLHSFEPQIYAYAILSIIPGVGAVLLLSRRKWWVLAGYGVTLMLVLWAVGLSGLGRYTGSAWPVFLPIAAWLVRRSALQMPVLVAFALLQAMFLYLFCHSYPIN